MDIVIKPLSEVNQNDFFSLFDDSNFSHQEDWKSCYCISYHTTYNAKEWEKRSGEDNKNEAIAKISSGQLQGFLAYEGNLCVGWMNVNNTLSYLRIVDELDERFKDGKTALAICYIVRKEYRGKHIASYLLEFAISNLKKQGYKTLVSLIYKSQSHVHNFSGPLKMYLDRGFKEYTDESGRLYVVKNL